MLLISLLIVVGLRGYDTLVLCFRGLGAAGYVFGWLLCCVVGFAYCCGLFSGWLVCLVFSLFILLYLRV